MATFEDLDQYWNPGLELTVHRKRYEVPLPSAELGLWCQRIMQAAGHIHNAETEADAQAAVARIEALPELPGDLTLSQRCLGEVYQQMVDNGVEHPYIEFCGHTAYLWIAYGEELAQQYWISGGRPEAMRPTPANRAERRAQAAGGTSTGGDDGTRSPASTSGTSTRRPSRRRGRGRRSPGNSS